MSQTRPVNKVIAIFWGIVLVVDGLIVYYYHIESYSSVKIKRNGKLNLSQL